MFPCVNEIAPKAINREIVWNSLQFSPQKKTNIVIRENKKKTYIAYEKEYE